MMKEVEIHFASGREVLGAYWGHLSGGGLAIEQNEQTQELYEGQPVSLRVHVASHQRIAVQGKVVRTKPHKAMIAFDVGESQIRLLTAALSGRYIDTEARVVVSHMAAGVEAVVGRVFELSEDGCCIHLADEHSDALSVGTEVSLELDGLRVSGCVFWAEAGQRWILFGSEGADEAVRAYLQAHA